MLKGAWQLKTNILMLIKSKKNLFFLFAFMVGAVLVNFLELNHRQMNYSCLTDANFSTVSVKDIYKLDADFNLLASGKNNIALSVSGVLYINNISYNVDRVYYFTSLKLSQKNIFKMDLISKSVSDSDAAGTGLMEKFFSLPREKQSVFIKLSRIKSNLYLIEGLSRSYLTCTTEVITEK